MVVRCPWCRKRYYISYGREIRTYEKGKMINRERNPYYHISKSKVIKCYPITRECVFCGKNW